MKNSIQIKIVTILTAIFMLSGLSSFATHFRYGTISYEVMSESGAGATKQTTVKFTINQGWRKTYFNGVSLGATVSTDYFFYGDGYNSQILLNVTAINNADDWFLGTATLTHTYTGNVNVTSYTESCCRISTLKDGNADNDYRNEALVTLSKSFNDSPRSSLPAIVHVQDGLAAFALNLSAIDPNNNVLTYAMATPAQSYLSTSSIFTSINSSTGVVTLNTSGAAVYVGNLYALQFMITDSKGATTPIDFIVRVVGNSNPPFVIAPTPATGTTFKVQPGAPVNFTIAASDVDAGDLVTILGSGIPVGATFVPGMASNPVSVPFSWTPTLADLGAYSVTFSATDNNYVQTLTTINIIVSYAPQFDVPPTPATGTHLIVVPGNNVTFTVQATDPDPTDVCRITSATGKDYVTNLPVPMYTGVLLSPGVPTNAANTTGTLVSWTPTQAQWGHRHMLFTATDGYLDQTTHEVSILVNTPPMFTSTPLPTACVGQMYSYQVVSTDPDMAQGDMIDLLALNMPSWLTFTDNGNGTGTLSGMPTASNLGVVYMSMSAQDMHHHDNGTTNQNFSITVNTCGINTCPPATVTITPTGLNAMWVNQGASDPYTFYYGLVNAKRLNAKIVGGVGPFAYNWSNSGTGTLLPRMYYPDQSIDLLEPTAATTISVTVTDLSNMCQYMGTIAINVDDSYFCGKTGNTWNILICEGGITKCVDWNTGRNKIRAHTATLGSCGGLKQNVSTTATAAMLVYPNPSNGVITIQFSASSYAKGSIVVVDMHGRTLLQNETDFVMGVQERQLDMTHFANGIYLIKVISGDDVKTEKIQILK